MPPSGAAFTTETQMSLNSSESMSTCRVARWIAGWRSSCECVVSTATMITGAASSARFVVGGCGMGATRAFHQRCVWVKKPAGRFLKARLVSWT